MKFLSFSEARKFTRNLRFKSRSEWYEYCKSGNKPEVIRTEPTRYEEWKGWGDWLGTGTIRFMDRNYRSFKNARIHSSSLGLKTGKEWIEYCKSGNKPDDIPSYPNAKYKKEWKGWGDWLGTGRISPKYRIYKNFENARNYTRSLGLKSAEQWHAYCKSGKIPEDIRIDPTRYDEWKGWGDWLGTGTIASFNKKFRQFAQSKGYVHKLNLQNREQWFEYCKSGKKPQDIPIDPSKTYKQYWNDWVDWLGSSYIRRPKQQYRPFMTSRDYVQKLGLKSREEWKEYCKSGKIPEDIRIDPTRYDEWKGWGDWLGTGNIAATKRKFRPFSDARSYIHSLGFRGRFDWDKFRESPKRPHDIPANPGISYAEEWNGWDDWLGTGRRAKWSLKKIKKLLRDLIESKIIYSWDEAVLYSFLLRKGLLNLQGRHGPFFQNLIPARTTSEGRRTLEKYAYSDLENAPDLLVATKKQVDELNEIQIATNQDLKTMVEDDPLDYQSDWSVEEILSHTDALESINVDEEAMQFYVDYSVDELWRSAFKNEAHTVRKVKEAGKNGNKYHDTVINSFLEDYEGSTKLEIPSDYSFPYGPTLMQRYLAYKITSLPYFGNFSGTGAGKTLSAILASRTTDSKLTVIVCPNDVVEQWKRNILDTFPSSRVTTGKDAFHVEYLKMEYKYAVLNYDKFSQEESPNLILNLAKQRVDFVILDEIHFTKIRNEEEISQRRKNLDGLMTGIRKMNPSVKVLGLSATPVVNNLREGRSLLELISGKVYDDVAVRPTIPNAVTLYEKLSTISTRELPSYSVDIDTHTIDVTAHKPTDISVRHLKSNPLAIEKFLTDARIPEIVKLIDGQTIIYTEYVEDIIQKLSKAVDDFGYSYALYTGFDRSGLSRFLNKKVQVLIASRPLSVGVDGLQHICNRLIINTLPWTNAQYQQLIGRLVRKGQIRDVVHVCLVKASIGGYQYDELKWKRIQFKRTLADCAVDGRLPEKNLVTPQQAAMEAVKWLERLERGEISTVVKRDLNVELTPVELKKRVIKYGDFTKLNNKINSENFDTTHHRILKDPKEWDEYHRQYREARRSWLIIPFDETIKRIQQLSPRLLIGDFGCGEAKILEKFGADRVFSFDHVAINNKVTACDIKSVPLSDEAIDIAVFSLSLMGRNWPDYIKEAKRCLATNGYLLIAETAKSMNGRLSKLKEVIEKEGFDIYNLEEKGDFCFIEAREL